MKTLVWSVLRYNRFTFGDQVVSQFVVFEHKRLFSIIFFYFHKSTGEQDRFHTHAFNAWSVKLFGQYTESILNTGPPETIELRRRTEIVRYFPRESFHKIGNSNGCMTLLLSGPWSSGWKESKNGEIVDYTWGRSSR